MMRYGFSGTWRSFTTAGGGPAGGHARPRVPPPHPTTVRTVPLRIATRMRRATCIVSPSLRKGVVRRCPTLQPVPERVRVVGQAPLFEDRQGHGAYAAFAATGGQALLVQPGLEFVRLGVGGDAPLEQVPLDRQTDRVGCRVAPTAAPPPLRRVDGGEELTADLTRAGWRAVAHRKAKPSSARRRTTIRTSSAYPGRSGRRYPRSSAATSSGTVVRSSSRIAHGASARTVVKLFTYPLQLWQTSILRVCSPASGVR